MLWVVLGVAVALVLVLTAAGVGTYLLVHKDTAGTTAGTTAGGSDDPAPEVQEPGGTGDSPASTKIAPVTKKPSKVWQWETGEDVGWATPGPGFTLVELGGKKGGFVALDDRGKEKWRGEAHPYSTLWVDEEDKVIEAGWYVATVNGADDQGTIIYDYSGKVLWRQTGGGWFYDVEKDGDYLVSTDTSLQKLDATTKKPLWSIPQTDYAVTDDAIYTIAGDQLVCYARADAKKKWSVALPAGWKTGLESYDIGFRSNDDMLMLTGTSTYAFSLDDGHLLWHTADKGSLVELADDRFTVIPDGYDATTGRSTQPKGPFPVLAKSGKVGSITLKATDSYAYMQIVEVDGKAVNFHQASGALFDADGKLIDDGYDHVAEALNEGAYRIVGTTVSYRPWHEHSDAWSMPLTGIASLATKDDPDTTIRLSALDGGLLINDKHSVWLYR